MASDSFSQPLRQSSKGVIIIFAFNAFKFFKRFFVVLIAFGLSLLRKKSFANLTPSTILWIVTGILVILLIIAVLKYLNFKFHIHKDDFHLATGIINKETTIIPKSKIQNVYIKQNFLQQVINVVSLSIETAGDKKSEIEISALEKSTALRLKAELFQTSKSSSAETASNEVSKVYFRVSFKRLLLEGLSQNHLKSFAVIASFVFGLYYEFEEYAQNLKLKERLNDLLNVEDESIRHLILTNLIIVIAVLLLTMLFSIVRTVISNFNLEVVEHQKTIEINKGLFNKVSLSLTPSRIQNIVVKTNRVKRYFGLHTLSVKQAMVHVKQRKNFSIIALEKPQLHHLIGKLYDTYTNEGEVQKPARYYVRIMAIKATIVVLLLNFPLYLLIGPLGSLANVVLVPLAVLYCYVAYQKAYFRISEAYITIGSGVIETVTNILGIHNIQALTLRQSIFQKRLNIASIVIATASKTVTIPYIKMESAQLIYDNLLFKVESQDRDWM